MTCFKPLILFDWGNRISKCLNNCILSKELLSTKYYLRVFEAKQCCVLSQVRLINRSDELGTVSFFDHLTWIACENHLGRQLTNKIELVWYLKELKIKLIDRLSLSK